MERTNLYSYCYNYFVLLLFSFVLHIPVLCLKHNWQCSGGRDKCGLRTRRESRPIRSPSLVPRPHPLTRRNGLVNQVELALVSCPDPTLSSRVGAGHETKLAHTFATRNLATIKTFCGQPAQKRYGCLNEGHETTVVLRNNYRFRNLIGHKRNLPVLGNEPKKFDFVHLA